MKFLDNQNIQRLRARIPPDGASRKRTGAVVSVDPSGSGLSSITGIVSFVTYEGGYVEVIAAKGVVHGRVGYLRAVTNAVANEIGAVRGAVGDGVDLDVLIESISRITYTDKLFKLLYAALHPQGIRVNTHAALFFNLPSKRDRFQAVQSAVERGSVHLRSEGCADRLMWELERVDMPTGGEIRQKDDVTLAFVNGVFFILTKNEQ